MGFDGDRRFDTEVVTRVTLWGVVLSVFLGLAAAQPLSSGSRDGQDSRELFPVVFNLATRARISANATCGQSEPEVFCKLVEHVQIFPAENRHCDICDARSENPLQRHPITNAIDGSNLWWQSPTLTNGDIYNHVTVTLDLGSIYQVAYVIIKAANSPRPGNWILERSVDGHTFHPWQYFAMTDEDCWRVYGVPATVGVPTSLRDDQVICTSRYSRLDPLEDGEIFISIVNARPGVFQPSRVLLEFTSARYVQLRLQKIRTLNADLMFFKQFSPKELDPSVTRRYFYSIKDISIGGQCICYGHATYCQRHATNPERFQCQCEHNTGGDNCEKCLPLFNQRRWRTGGIQGLGCEECNCHGKAAECVYNATVDALGLSLNKDGVYAGGGVCLNCQEFTIGINCERCIDGYYRLRGYSPSSRMPCRPCSCRETATSTSQCVLDDSRVHEGLNPGDCICRQGFGGSACTACAFGYYGYPNCRPCPCNPAGTINSSSCEQPCRCKPSVRGVQCDQCHQGYFNLNKINPQGCTECFCFGVTTLCRSATWGLTQITDLDGWVLSTLEKGGLTLLPRFFNGWLEAKTYLLNVNSIDVIIGPTSTHYTPSTEVHYWIAPMTFLGNRISSYGGQLKYTVKYTLDGNLTNRFYLADPDVILRGSDMTIAHGRQFMRENQEHLMMVHLRENDWYHTENRQPVSRRDFMVILYSLDQIMIKATYHIAQDTVYLRDVSLDVASPLVMSSQTLPSVEQCQCPEGYAGLSCESCAPGWRRENSQLFGGACRRCECNNHAADCDPNTGACQACRHNTVGINCERCLPGFHGDPRRGTEIDCRPCACPLISGNNFFAEYCVSRPTVADRNAYECVNCQEGYEGIHCERCASGYYGRPSEPGGICRKCNCGGNIDPSNPGSCDNITGACNICTGNTEGDYCERCRSGYFGSALNGDCQVCSCSPQGSLYDICDQRTGQCTCRQLYTGRQCDRCVRGYGDVSEGCVRCSCSMTGSVSGDCDPVSGQCQCQRGVGGKQCDRCAEGYYGISQQGCQQCDCYSSGTSNITQCDPRSGRCICQPNVIGERCDQCQAGYYGIRSGQGCLECACDSRGSTSTQCNPTDGQCRCRLGVGGRACNQCQPGYYGFSRTGCKQCKPCSASGHICDQNTGECVCPPNTEGPNCERCVIHTYDWDLKGCKRCNCTKEGSASQQCDRVSGVCTCLPGFHGFSCEACLSGYYGFPHCDACMCSPSGSEPESCTQDQALCKCGDRGQCHCKVNVEGEQCDRCAPRTFSLQRDNPKGCTECYCFYRSQDCRQAPYVWNTISVPTRRVTISPQAVQPVIDLGDYLVINSSHVMVEPSLRNRPLYWIMPAELFRDKTISYNGRLDFIHLFNGPLDIASSQGLSPLVVLKGNGFELHGEVSSLEPNHADSFSVRLHENFWQLPGQQPPVSRRLLMVVLQNLTYILIRASQNGWATYAEIGPISLEIAHPSQNQNASGREITAYGVEQCYCPERYSGLSCQDPAPGYFRVRPDTDPNIQVPENVIGHVRPCQCYSHSNTCHPETGICTDCRHNTFGDHCDQCAPGYYGLATRGTPNDCTPCACPLPEPSNNFSPTCKGMGSNLMCTRCDQGYTGSRCERCQSGYFGNPTQLGSKCQPCDCTPDGSVGSQCDPVTGQCQCRPGIQGRRCDGCSDPGQGVQNGLCISCYEGCTGELLNDLKELTLPNNLINVTGGLYPWEKLYQLSNETEELRAIMDAVHLTSLEGLSGIKERVNFYVDYANNLYIRAVSICGDQLNITNSKVGTVRMKTKETLLNATDIENIVNELYKEIQGNISQLRSLVEKLYYSQTGINVTAALHEAQNILAVILARDFADADKAAALEGLAAERLSERIKNMASRVTNSSVVAGELARIRTALEDLYSQSNNARNKAVEVLDEQSQRLGALIADLEDKLQDLKEIKEDIENLLKEGRDLNAEAEAALQRHDENILELDRQLFTLKAATDELNRRFDILRNAMPRLEQLYQDAWQHALDLQKMAQQLERLFEKVRLVAEDPMKAARAYESIVLAINQAEAAAKQALQTARDTVTIANLDDLQAEVNRSIARSRQLLRDAKELMEVGVKELTGKLNSVKTDFVEAQRKHQAGVDLLTLLHDILASIPQGYGDRLEVILRKVNLIVERAKKTNETVTTIQYNINFVLLPNLQELQNININAIIYNVDADIANAQSEARNITAKLPETEVKIQENARKALNISDKIIDLKRKINEARSLTNNMKMSLYGEGNCARSYRSQLTAGVTNEISLSVKLNRTGVDMLLILLQDSPMEYLVLEIRNNRVRFTWDVGQGPQSVTHNLALEVFSPGLEEDEKWYSILAKRVGPIGQLKVWRIRGSEDSAEEVTGRSTSGLSFINFSSNSSMYIAGVGEAYQVPAGVTRGRLYGCVGDVSINGKPVGVYNFKSSEGQCQACTNVPQPPPSVSVYSFDGTGYATDIFPIRSYQSTYFRLVLEFKTFWENSRLFFSGNPQGGDFVALDLVEGKVFAQFYLGGNSIIRLRSVMIYNTNKWTKITLIRTLKNGILTIMPSGVGTQTETVNATSAGNNTALDIRNQSIYFGGLPTTLNLSPFSQLIDVKNSRNLLGCMKNIDLGTLSQDLSTFVLAGVSLGCKDSNLRQVSFYGSGYVMFDGVSLGAQANVSLSFFTNQRNALLLLGRDVRSDYFYSLALINGQLEARLAANSAATVLKSTQTYNDSALHYVALLKNDRRLQMLVDDVLVAEGQLPAGVTEIPLGLNSNLYFGGANISVNDMVASNAYLDGCISDIIINGRLVDLSQAKQYSKADIGRCKDSFTPVNGIAPELCERVSNDAPSRIPNPPLPRLTAKPTISAPVVTAKPTISAPVVTTARRSLSTSTCSPFRMMDAGLEDNAKTLGNSDSSFAQISKNIRLNELRQNFNITFQFRTFFKDGLFGLLKNADQTVYFAAQLREGIVEVIYTYRGRQSRISSSGNLADGLWHSGQIIKEETRLQLTVDGIEAGSGQIVARLRIDLPLYIGGLPQSEDLRIDVVKHSIRGCVRNLHLDSHPVDITDTDIISGVEHCYVSVEPGVGFTSDSWGIYDVQFDVGVSVTIEVEFKTGERNGILLTIGTADGASGLTLELSDGKVVFALKTTDETIRAESSNIDPNEYCTNQWHTVRASLLNNVVLLNVDNSEVSQTGQSNSVVRPTDSPLLIGGFPSTFDNQAASISGKGFHGCMRNLFINGVQVDWYKLEISSSLLRTACPL